MNKNQTLTILSIAISLLFSCRNNPITSKNNLGAINKDTPITITKDSVKKTFKKHPIVSLKINAVSCKFNVQVNGYEIFSNEYIYPISGKFPINHCIQNGENIITITQIFNNQEAIKGSSCKVSLLIKQYGDDNSEAEVITSLKLENGKDTSLENSKMISKNSNIKFDSNKIVLQHVVSTPTNIPKWNWFSSDIITDTKENRASLYKEYQKIHKALSNKNLKLVKQLMSERLIEYGASFNLTPQEMFVLSNIETDILDQEQELLPLEKIEDNEFVIMGNGKLVKITRWNGAAQIIFGYKDESLYGEYELIYRKSGDQWILTR